jgi:hypothetical protein
MTSTGVEFKTLFPVIGLSMFMFVVCMSMFGIAVHRGMNRLFAPRSWARPKAVSAMLYLYGVQDDNAILLLIIEVTTNAELNQNQKHHNCLQSFKIFKPDKQIIKNQIKKPYGLTWIPWALKLSYSEMLEGIEGTGTRNNGWSGTKLRCNLDGIILIKFVNLCLKVSVLATILCIGLVLPVNFTANCVSEAYEDIDEFVCENITQLTTFEKTTMANIPQLIYNDNSTWYSPDLFKDAFGDSTGITMRMLTTMLVCFAIYAYACGKLKYSTGMN